MHDEIEVLPPAASVDVWTYVDELIHRTLNDYTVMHSSVQNTASRLRDTSSRTVLEDIAYRIRAQAIVQRLLRPPRDDGPRRLDADLTRLCAALSDTVLAERKIGLTFFCRPATLQARRAWQTSLIVHELIMNAARHAFIEKDHGAIWLEMRQEAQYLRFDIADNGSASAAPAPGGGTAIIDALVGDLGGEISRTYSLYGSTACIRIPASHLLASARAAHAH